ncbi:MAG: ribbon-helix-helix protein, CopG family [Myxococcales bacterium]|nr:ribbon-helix-helix protein, CopG family [Myxococcales bacterium]
MNFNLYVDAATGARLDRLARRRRTTRNALIREAVSRLLDGTGDACWPREVVLFEEYRALLASTPSGGSYARHARIRSREVSARHLRSQRLRARR